MKRFTTATLLAALVASAGLLSACNTIQGAGEDVEQAGEGIQNSAEEHDGD